MPRYVGNRPEKELLFRSAKRQACLKKMNDSGNPVDGTYSRIARFAKKISESGLRRGEKLAEFRKWAELLADHLILRIRQGDAGLAKGLESERQKMVEEILASWRKEFKI
ncbi:MAG: hypothetical protein PHH08_00730 [Candidatus ainarchaeum sp.]|nr:hypothetical protein [Candidatus ainarchaeum sp.]